MRRLVAVACALAAIAGLAYPYPAQAAEPQTILTIGDSWNEGVGDRVTSNGLGWSPATAKALGLPLTRDGKGGSGYVNPTTYGAGVFGDRVYRHKADGYRVVIIQGSTNDKAYLSRLAGNANWTLKAAKARYPSARLVVVGPVSISGRNDAETLAVRDKLRAAAAVAGVPFVDGIAEGWFVPGDWSRYSNAATGHPNDAAYQLIGQRVAADVKRMGY